MQQVQLSTVDPTPWKNGGGLTRDLLFWPGATDWALRVSVAMVARGGPFSAYPGIERWFCVLSGAGVVLHFGSAARTLTPDSPSLCFDGALAPECTLVDGPTLDLNLMARQGSGTTELQRALTGQHWAGAAPLRGVFTQQAATLHGATALPLPLAAGTLAFDDEALAGPWWLQADDLAANASASAWWLSHMPHRP